MRWGVKSETLVLASNAPPPSERERGGLGGLGHLGIQYAAKMGFHTIGIARGKDKELLARKLGASVYMN